MPIDEEKAFTMSNQEGLYSPRHVSQGVLNATPRFQSMMDQEMLKCLVPVIYKAWVGGIFM